MVAVIVPHVHSRCKYTCLVWVRVREVQVNLSDINLSNTHFVIFISDN